MPHPLRASLFPYTTLFRSQFGVAHIALDRPVLGVAGAAERLHRLDRRLHRILAGEEDRAGGVEACGLAGDRKSTRLNSSHLGISYAVFCLKKKKKHLHYCI